MYWIRLALCFGVVRAIFTGNIKDDHQLELKDWQALLFPQEENPLDDLVGSSSTSEENENDPFPNYVFRTRFRDKGNQEQPKHKIHKQTAEFFTDEWASVIENEWLGSQIKDFSLKVLRLNLTIYDLKIIILQFPEIRFERVSPNIINLIASGGNAVIRGMYKSVYRTIRQGQIEISVNDLDVNLKLHFHHSQSCGPYLFEMECKPNIGKIELDFKPFLLKEVEDAVQQHFWTSFQREICSRSENYLQKTDDKSQQFE